MKTFKLIIFVLAFILLAGSDSYSQNDTTRAKEKEKLRKVVKEKLIEKLNIDEATAGKFIEITAANRKEMKEYNKKRKELTDYIFDNPQSSDIGTKLEELLDTENKVNQTRNEYYAKLKAILTPNQIAQAMVFQKELVKFMKKEMKRDKGDDRGGRDKDDKRKDDKGDDRNIF